MNQENSKKNCVIDILRLFGLICIVLAHTNAPNILLELRSFDVPLLTFISGMSFYINVSKNGFNYGSYIIKRFKKLLLSTWVILVVVFVGLYIFNPRNYPFSAPIIIESFMLFDGIGYVWFIRVMLMLAIVSPLFLALKDKQRSDNTTIIILIIWVLVYTCLFIFYNSIHLPKYIDKFVYHIVIFLLGYGIIYYIGMIFLSLRKRTKFIIFIVSIIILILALYKNGLSITSSKYPPGAKYVSYGICVSIVLFEALKLLKISIIPKWISFVSRNSLTIYLLHIPLIMYLNCSVSNVSMFFKSNFILEFLFLFIIPVIMCVYLCLIRDVIGGK